MNDHYAVEPMRVFTVFKDSLVVSIIQGCRKTCLETSSLTSRILSTIVVQDLARGHAPRGANQGYSLGGTGKKGGAAQQLTETGGTPLGEYQE